MVENKKVRHVAIIMDGNGRWAKKRNLPHLEGHRKGAEAVRKVIKSAKELDIEYITLFAFSTENWKRSKGEIDGLMSLLEEFIDYNLEELNEKDIRFKSIGRIDEFPPSTCRKIKEAIESTSGNKSGTLVLALNYGGRAEIVDAVKKLAEKAVAGEVKIDEINEELLSANLYDPSIPDPDIMIRTSGEFRLSNFLLWELSYSEIYITDVLWPDFDKAELLKALESFKNRDRRFGGRKKVL